MTIKNRIIKKKIQDALHYIQIIKNVFLDK